MRVLNLATRPFRNEALRTLAFAISSLVLLALTAKHALVVRALLPDKTSALHDEVKVLDAEAARLRLEASAFRAPFPDAAVVTRWSAIKDLVDQRTFSWTRLLVRLEKVVPEGVRISSIAPSVRQGEVRLDLSAQAQTTEAGFELVNRLQKRPEFSGVMPVSVGESGTEGEVVKEFKYVMAYDPQATPTDEAAPGKDDAGGVDATGESEDAAP